MPQNSEVLTIDELKRRQAQVKKTQAKGKKRVNATWVDERGHQIHDFASWRKQHPHALAFPSRTEWRLWHGLRRSGIPFDYQPRIVLVEGCTDFDGSTIGDFVFTPDFFFPWCREYADTKGWKTELFEYRLRLWRWKMVQENTPATFRIIKDAEEVDRYLWEMKARWEAV
jgi:hypothetical protein